MRISDWSSDVCSSDLFPSHDITQDEDGNPTEGVGEVIIAKNRSGTVDTVRLRFIGKFTKFTDLDGFYRPLPDAPSGGFNRLPSTSGISDFERGGSGSVTFTSKANQRPAQGNGNPEEDFPF